MCNGTIALEIATRALDLQGEVIVPSFTFVATAHALQWQGITPIFCDINPETYTADPASVEKMITPRTTGVIGVHLWGRPCDIDALSEVANNHGLKVLFDAAHAFGCSYKGRMVGGFGEAEVFSFHATKFFNTFEGGAVTTNSDELAEKIRLMRNFGFSDYDNVIYIGTNGKMSEVAAAMGLTGLDSLAKFVEAGRRNYESYRSQMEGIPGIGLMSYPDSERCNYQYIILRVNWASFGIDRDDLIKVLHAENVLARRYFYPGCHRMEPYRSYYPHAGLLVPKTEKVARQVVALPTGTTVTEDEIRRICNIIRLVAVHGVEIRHRMAGLAESSTSE